MINARAKRRFSLAGKMYQEGAPIRLADNQFADLASVGLVEAQTRAPPPYLTTRISGATRTRRARKAS